MFVVVMVGDCTVGVATSSSLGRVQSELRVASREWFASSADDVLVGHIQCTAVSAKETLRRHFPQTDVYGSGGIDKNMYLLLKSNVKDKDKRDESKSKGCLHMALKLDREMQQNGKMLSEAFIRTVFWGNRRKYTKISEPKGARSTNNPHMMAFSLSHAPTCGTNMHRFVESCGIVYCYGSTKGAVEWGENTAGGKAMLCNDAEGAVVVSTTVIGNYPKDPKACFEWGKPYNDEVLVYNIRFTTIW
jgi:hypothetical protein